MKFLSLPILLIFCVSLLSACVRDNDESAPIANGWSSSETNSPNYVVRPGDTLYSIAWAFGLDYRALAARNHLQPPYAIHPGQRLSMSVAEFKATPPTSRIAEDRSQPHLVVQTPEAIKAPAKPIRLKTHPATPKALTHPPQNRPVHRWILPAQGRIIKSFSTLSWGNKGIDLKGVYGEPVLASAAGQVVYAGAGIRAYGNLIILKHNESYLSAYAYNKNIVVKEGAWVQQGQKIGTMGRTDAGIVSLHFEIRRNGQPVNPLLYLPKK